MTDAAVMIFGFKTAKDHPVRVSLHHGPQGGPVVLIQKDWTNAQGKAERDMLSLAPVDARRVVHLILACLEGAEDEATA